MLHLARRLARRKRGLHAVLALAFLEARSLLGAIVVAFSFIGVLSFVQAIVDPTKAAFPFLDESPRRLALAKLAGLPEYPGARCSEYRAEVFDDEHVTEIEYVVDSTVPEVSDHYRDAFARGHWTVTDTSWIHGELVYTVNCGERRGVVEIASRSGLIEVEVEMAEPAVTGPAVPASELEGNRRR